MIETAHAFFSSTMVVLFVLLFVRSGFSVIGSIVHRLDPQDTVRARGSAYLASKNSLYALAASLSAKCNDFVVRVSGKGIMDILSISLTPVITILTSIVFVGAVFAAFTDLSLATLMELYIVYVLLQLPYVLCKMAFENKSIELLGELFVDIFWPVHKRTLNYFAAAIAAARAPFVSA